MKLEKEVIVPRTRKETLIWVGGCATFLSMALIVTYLTLHVVAASIVIAFSVSTLTSVFWMFLLSSLFLGCSMAAWILAWDEVQNNRSRWRKEGFVQYSYIR